MQVDNNWYWNQHPQQHVITVPTNTVLHERPELNALTDFHAITRSACNRAQAKQSISRHPICLTDSGYDYILNKLVAYTQFGLK